MKYFFLLKLHLPSNVKPTIAVRKLLKETIKKIIINNFNIGITF